MESADSGNDDWSGGSAEPEPPLSGQSRGNRGSFWLCPKGAKMRYNRVLPLVPAA